MRSLFSLLVVLLLVFPSIAIISMDQLLLKNGVVSKRASFDVPGEIQPKGVTGQPKLVKQIIG